MVGVIEASSNHPDRLERDGCAFDRNHLDMFKGKCVHGPNCLLLGFAA